MNLYSAELLVSIITFFIAYVAVNTLVGAFRAWVAYRLGDDTAQQVGLMSLNPIAHIDPIGALFLFFTYIGWGRYVPINPNNIYGPNRFLKLIALYAASPVGYFCFAVLGLLMLILISGSSIIMTAPTMIAFPQCLTHLFIANAHPEFSSLTISLAFILIVFIYLSTLFCVIDLIINGCHLTAELLIERSPEYVEYRGYLMFLVPILIMVFFSSYLRYIVTMLMVYGGIILARLLHIA
jgi:hypothetical protein